MLFDGSLIPPKSCFRSNSRGRQGFDEGMQRIGCESWLVSMPRKKQTKTITAKSNDMVPAWMIAASAAGFRATA